MLHLGARLDACQAGTTDLEESVAACTGRVRALGVRVRLGLLHTANRASQQALATCARRVRALTARTNQLQEGGRQAPQETGAPRRQRAPGHPKPQKQLLATKGALRNGVRTYIDLLMDSSAEPADPFLVSTNPNQRSSLTHGEVGPHGHTTATATRHPPAC